MSKDNIFLLIFHLLYFCTCRTNSVLANLFTAIWGRDFGTELIINLLNFTCSLFSLSLLLNLLGWYLDYWCCAHFVSKASIETMLGKLQLSCCYAECWEKQRIIMFWCFFPYWLLIDWFLLYQVIFSEKFLSSSWLLNQDGQRLK